MTARSELFQSTFSKRFIALVALVIFAAGCGDGGNDSSTAASDSSSNSGSSGGSSVSLQISGNPPSQIMEGTALSFTPTVTNPGNVTLSFSATNLPGWASINTSTGKISGTPSSGDVGTYSNIRVTVSGGGTSVTSKAYSIEVVAVALGSATLSWIPPTEKTDGSPLDNLAGYKVYYGQNQNNLNQSITINNVGQTSAVIDNLTPATWYFAATAFDTDGMESAFSNTASKIIM